MSESTPKSLNGNGVVVAVYQTRDEAQAYLDRREQIPPGYFLIGDQPLRLYADELPDGHVWASDGTVLLRASYDVVAVDTRPRSAPVDSAKGARGVPCAKCGEPTSVYEVPHPGERIFHNRCLGMPFQDPPRVAP